ncbi:MAG: hypothetical protein PHE49_06715 [bacterium]|nr:hypothetical protein [bacterium]
MSNKTNKMRKYNRIALTIFFFLFFSGGKAIGEEKNISLFYNINGGIGHYDDITKRKEHSDDSFKFKGLGGYMLGGGLSSSFRHLSVETSFSDFWANHLLVISEASKGVDLISNIYVKHFVLETKYRILSDNSEIQMLPSMGISYIDASIFSKERITTNKDTTFNPLYERRYYDDGIMFGASVRWKSHAFVYSKGDGFGSFFVTLSYNYENFNLWDYPERNELNTGTHNYFLEYRVGYVDNSEKDKNKEKYFQQENLVVFYSLKIGGTTRVDGVHSYYLNIGVGGDIIRPKSPKL